MLKHVSITLLGAILALTQIGCASDADVKKSMDEYKSIFSSYFKILKDNKADPKKAVKLGGKFISEKENALKEIGKRMGGYASQKGAEIAQKGAEEIKSQNEKAIKDLREAFANDNESITTVGKQISRIGEIVGKAQAIATPGGGDGKVPDSVRAKQKEMILQNLDAYKSIPAGPARESALANISNGLTGASDSEKAEFKSEIKKKLGW